MIPQPRKVQNSSRSIAHLPLALLWCLFLCFSSCAHLPPPPQPEPPPKLIPAVPENIPAPAASPAIEVRTEPDPASLSERPITTLPSVVPDNESPASPEAQPEVPVVPIPEPRIETSIAPSPSIPGGESIELKLPSGPVGQVDLDIPEIAPGLDKVYWRYRPSEGPFPAEPSTVHEAPEPSPPRPEVPAANPADPEFPAIAMLETTMTVPSPPEPPRRATFGERTLAQVSLASMAGMDRVATWRTPGRSRSALVIVAPRWKDSNTRGGSGSAALCLALIARDLLAGSSAGAAEGSALVSAVADLGEGLGILAVGENGKVADLLARVEATLRSPAFLAPDFRDEDFQAGLRDLRTAARLRESAGLVDGDSQLGDEVGLRGIGLEALRGFWKTWAPTRRIALALVGDLAEGDLVSQARSDVSGFLVHPGAGSGETASEKTSFRVSKSLLTLSIPLGEFLNCPRSALVLLSEFLAYDLPASGRPWSVEGEGLRLCFFAPGGSASGLAFIRQNLHRLMESSITQGTSREIGRAHV